MENYIYVYFPGFDQEWEKCHYWFKTTDPIEPCTTIVIQTKYGNFEGFVLYNDVFETPPKNLGVAIVSKSNIKQC